MTDQKPKNIVIPGYGSIALRGQDIKKRFGSTIQNFRKDDLNSRNMTKIEHINGPLTEEPVDIARKK